jgi:Ni2+-binding GTPase involved in maturation of urease and hydrogenase
MDLAEACDFDAAAAQAAIEAVRPGMRILSLSSKTGVGMGTWLDALYSGRRTLAATNTPA